MTAGPLALLIGIVAGILAGERLGASGAVPVLLTGGLAAACSLTGRGRRHLALAMVAASLLACAATQRALDGLARSPLAAAVAGRRGGSLVATLVDDPVTTQYSTRVLVRSTSFAGRASGGRTVLVVAGRDVGRRLAVLEAGDRITLDGRLRPLTAFDRRQRWRHAVGRFDAHKLSGFSAPRGLLARTANTARALVLRGTQVLPTRERALLAGFLLGDTRGIDAREVGEFRAAGLSHLLAVSGANVAFALALVGPLLRRLRLGTRFVAGLATLAVFGTMTRWEPSVLRACAMAGLAMLAVLVGRPVPAARLLVLAVGGLLLADPFLLHSVGFALSAGAAAGIVVLGAPLEARLRLPRVVREPLAATLAAQAGVLPVLLSVFGTIPLVALPANVLAVPAAGPITVWGLAAGVLGGLAGPDAARLLEAPTAALLHWVEVVAHAASGVSLPVDGRGVLGLVALGAALAAAKLLRSRTPVVSAATGSAARAGIHGADERDLRRQSR